jgi:hypothetical protein
VILAVLTSGCGLTIGIKSGTDARLRSTIQLADEDGHGVDPTTSSLNLDGRASQDDPDDGIGTGVMSTSAGDPGTASTQLTDTTTAPGDTPTSSPGSGSTSTSSTADDEAVSTTTTQPVPSTTEPPEPVGTVFADDEAFVTHQCDGNGVTISGDAGDYTLEGSCGAIVITGSFNTVFIEEVDSIDLTGTLNAVVYSAGNPVINDSDGDNIVTGG